MCEHDACRSRASTRAGANRRQLAQIAAPPVSSTQCGETTIRTKASELSNGPEASTLPYQKVGRTMSVHSA